MANTIDNFLVGLGFKYDDKGVKNFGNALGNIKSKALQLGALLGTSFAAKNLIFDKSEYADNLGKFADEIGVTASQVDSLGNAFKLMGSNADGAMSALQTITKLQSSSQPDIASRKAFLQSQGFSSDIISDIVKSKNAYSGYIKLIEDGNKLTNSQRIQLLDILGLNSKIALQMQQGPRELKDTLSYFQRMNPSINQLAKESQEFNDEWDKLKIQVSDIGNSISSDILPPLTKGLSLLNKFTEKHPKTMTGATAAAGGLVAATAASSGLGFLNSGYKGAVKGAILPSKLIAKSLYKSFPLTSVLSTEVALGQAAGPKYSVDDMPGSGFGMFKDSLTKWAISHHNENNEKSKKINDGYLPSQEKEFNRNNNDNNTPQNINLNINFDGETIVRKVIYVNNKAQTQAIHNIQSSIKG